MTNHPMSRRDFLLAGSVGGGLVLAGMVGQRKRPRLPAGLAASGTRVVARRNGTVHEMVGQCVDALGGMGSLVPAGSKVAIKVNGTWGNPAANTNLDVIREVILLVNETSPSSVTIYDHTLPTGGWPSVADAAHSVGAEAVELGDDDDQYVTKPVDGVGLTSVDIAKVLDEADVLINLPVLKTHSEGQVTIGLKNHLGSVRHRRSIHGGGGHGLHQGIADLNACSAIRSKHCLTVVDAIRPMVSGGPEVGKYADYNGIIAGTDPVATDYVGTQIIRTYNSSVPEMPIQIERAAALGLGTNDPNAIAFEGPGNPLPVPELPIGLAALGLASVLLVRKRSRKRRSTGSP